MGNCFRTISAVFHRDQPPEIPVRWTSDPNRSSNTTPLGASAQEAITIGNGEVSYDMVVQNESYFRSSSASGLSQNEVPVGQAVLVAQYSFESSEDGGLSFDKEDRMILMGDPNLDWLFVQHIRTGATGYVPSNYVAKEDTLESKEWFAGKIPRNLAEGMVLESNLPRGTFLVREREYGISEAKYILTIRDREGEVEKAKHYKIKCWDNGCFYIYTMRSFVSLQSLVDHYYATDDDKLCHKLTFPAPRIDPIRPDLSHKTQKNWEIPTDQLALKQKKLGSGNFGDVWYGKWRGVVEVAVKSLKQGSAMSKEAFLKEAAIMKQCNHPNLVKLYGVCSKQEPLFIVTEFMRNGSLLDYIKGRDAPLDICGIEDMCAQIANGMSYLEDRRMVHRDLAARNVLVGMFCI